MKKKWSHARVRIQKNVFYKWQAYEALSKLTASRPPPPQFWSHFHERWTMCLKTKKQNNSIFLTKYLVYLTWLYWHFFLEKFETKQDNRFGFKPIENLCINSASKLILCQIYIYIYIISEIQIRIVLNGRKLREWTRWTNISNEHTYKIYHIQKYIKYIKWAKI